MQFDQYIELTGSVTDPDPITNPATVPNARIFTLPIRSAQVDNVNNRVIVAVNVTGSGSSLAFTLYDVDEASTIDTDGNPTALSTWKWHPILAGTSLSNSDIVQSRAAQADEPFVGGGRYYLKCTTDYTTTTFKIKAINA